MESQERCKLHDPAEVRVGKLREGGCAGLVLGVTAQEPLSGAARASDVPLSWCVSTSGQCEQLPGQPAARRSPQLQAGEEVRRTPFRRARLCVGTSALLWLSWHRD